MVDVFVSYAREDQAFATAIPQRNAVHAGQVLDEPVTVLFVQMQDDFDVTAGPERVAASLQVRTRPTFSVVTRPACSRTPTCFFMPVSVMSNCPARSVIDASARASFSRTPRLVTSESAAKHVSRGAP
jgi:hypothetical protein